MSQMPVMVTGGRGMVGRNISELLTQHGYEVHAPPRQELDLMEYGQVLDFIQSHKLDAVIHAAGKVGGIQANIDSPVDFLEQNLVIGRNVVMASRKSGVTKLVNFGSSCMYPREAKNPLKEDMILTGLPEPTNEGYALAKIAVMRLCQYIAREDKRFGYKTLIPCNLYGKYDNFMPGKSHLLPAVISKIHDAKVKGSDVVEIWGTGEVYREFMFAGDVAEATLRALETYKDLPPVMNLGPGEDISVNQCYQIAAEAMGWSGRFEHDLDRPTGFSQKLVCVERQTQWGWSPKTSLSGGIKIAYDYYKSTL